MEKSSENGFRKKSIHVLVVGQTPPPLGGQAMMIERILKLSEPDLKLHHVRMDFSENMEEIGKVRFKKIGLLVSLVARIFIARIRTRSAMLYFPPAGPNRIPMFRDIVILVLCRWMFKRTVFHFHAGGLSQLYPALSAPIRFLFRRAYFHPDASIRISALNPEDGKALQSRKEYVIAYGIEDPKPALGTIERSNGVARILYVGKLCETKGILVLLEACRLLKDRNAPFVLDVVGVFESQGIKDRMMLQIERDGLGDAVNILGEKSGDAKFRIYARSDVFCFPTFFDAETFGLVSVEAMALGLPVVATRWRGVPSVVREGENAFLVPIKDPEALAGKLEILVRDPGLRETMGRRGRRIFEENYTLEVFHRRIAEVFREVHG